MAIFQGIFFLILSAGILVIDWRSLTSGALPFGSGRGGRLMIERANNALGYWCVFTLYLVFGLYLAGMALEILVGSRPPLPLQ